jgi:hypothetical protein
MKSFTVDLQKFEKKLNDKFDRFIQQFTLSLFTEVQTSTPVDTGFLRNSWYVSINELPVSGKDSDANIGVNFNLSNINEAKAGDTLYIVNSASYAKRIEYGFVGYDALGRFYNQQPQGMVRATINKADSIAEKVASEVQ